MQRRPDERRSSPWRRPAAWMLVFALASLASSCGKGKPPPKINESDMHKPLLTADAKTCMICHADPVRAEQMGGAPVMKHPPRANCISCHVAR